MPADSGAELQQNAADLSELSPLARRSLAGVLAQALAGADDEHLTHARGFWAHTCSEHLHLRDDIVRGLAPLLEESERLGTRVGNARFGIDNSSSPFAADVCADLSNCARVLAALELAWLAEGSYDARAREALRRVALACGVRWRALAEVEDAFAAAVVGAASAAAALGSPSVESSAAAAVASLSTGTPSSRGAVFLKWATISFAALAGGVLLAVTGGLAAPAILGGLAILGSAVGLGSVSAAAVAFLATTGGSALVLSLFGAAGSGLASFRMHRRLSGVRTLFFVRLTPPLSAAPFREGLHLYILCSGLLIDQRKLRVTRPGGDLDSEVEADFFQPWGGLPEASLAERELRDDSFAVEAAEAAQALAVGSSLHNTLTPPPQPVASSHATPPTTPVGEAPSQTLPPPKQDLDTAAPVAAAPVASILASSNDAALSPTVSWQAAATPPFTPAVLACEISAAPASRGWWRRRQPTGDAYAVVLEPGELRTVSNQITKFVRSYLVSTVVSSALAQTAFRALLAAWALPSYATGALSWIDAPLALMLTRSDHAGRMLADALLAGAHGARRPVSFVGFGFGARVFFSACLRLSEVADIRIARAAAQSAADVDENGAVSNGGKDDDTSNRSGSVVDDDDDDVDEGVAGSRLGSGGVRPPHTNVAPPGGGAAPTPEVNPLSLIHDVVLLGTPVAADPALWARVRRVTSGRVVNAFSRGDVVLSLVYRSHALTWAVAGAGPVGRAHAPGGNGAADVQVAAVAAAAAVTTDKIGESSAAAANASAPAATAPRSPTLVEATKLGDGEIESVDVTHIVSGHVQYPHKLEQVLTFIEWEG